MKRACWLAAVAVAAGCVGGGRLPPADTSPPPQPNPSIDRSAKTNPYKVFGQTYYPISDATGYRERGVASWYGGKFHGRSTANGERYDMYAMTAAHKTLPLPTWVQVTNLRNGASVVVRVNDRGPFAKNRLIDLSYAAAQKLDMVSDGTTLVEVSAIGPAALPGPAEPVAVAVSGPAEPVAVAAPGSAEPMAVAAPESAEPVAVTAPESAETVAVFVSGSAEPMAVAAPAPVLPVDTTAAADRSVFVQVGAFGELPNAQRLRSTLYNAGIDEVHLADGNIDGVPVYRVRIGPVRGVDEYDALVVRLDELGIRDSHLVTE